MPRLNFVFATVFFVLLGSCGGLSCSAELEGCEEGYSFDESGVCVEDEPTVPADFEYVPVDRERESLEDASQQQYVEMDVPEFTGFDLVELEPVIVNPEDLSFTLWIPYPDETYILPARITDPNGAVLYDLETDWTNYQINDRYDFHFVPDAGFLSLMLPNTERIELVPGEYKIEVFVEDSTPLENDPSVLVKQRNPGKMFDLNVWLVQVADLFDTVNPEDDDALSSALRVYRDLYAHVGVFLDETRFFTLLDAASQPYAYVNNIPEIHEICRKSEDAPEGVNVFLVRGIELEEYAYDGETFTILGYASGLPGPGRQTGTSASCVVISAEILDGWPRTLGATMAHETGHWFGLFHPTESTGTLFDAIDDTPMCPSQLDRNGDYVVTLNECQGRGADNLMFWQMGNDDSFAIGSSGMHLTEGQKWVIERHPEVRPASTAKKSDRSEGDEARSLE